MKTLARDDKLSDALATLVGYLRLGGQPFLGDALRAAADRFIDALAEHLRMEEDRLFPALGAASPAATEQLVPLKEDHVSLRVFASRLAQRMAVEDREGAAEVAEYCLQSLFRHLRREERAVDALISRLPPETTDRLLRRLGLHRTEED